jgi:kynurenine 3-monooxygenase
MRDRVDDPEFLLQRDLERALQERHPQRFVPNYTMVTVMRITYAVALERSEVQRKILVDAARGRHDLAGIDWDALAQVVHARLPLLEDAR